MYLLKDFNNTQYANIMKKSNNCRYLIKKNRVIKLKKNRATKCSPILNVFC